VRKADVLARLGPAGKQKEVDRDLLAVAEGPFAHRGRLGPRIGRVEQVEHLSFEVGGRQAVGDQHDLAVGRLLGRQQPPGEFQAVLDVREMGRDLLLADLRPAHVGPKPLHRVKQGDRLGKQLGQLAHGAGPCEGGQLDETQSVPGELTANETFQGESHPFDVHVLSVVPHRTAHVHQHHRGAFGRIAGAVDNQILGGKPHRQPRAGAENRIGEGLGQIEVGERIAELIGLGPLGLDRPLADNRSGVPAGAGGLQLAE